MTPKPLTLNKAAEIIHHLNFPLLIADTCSLLDIVRVPIRADKSNIAKSILKNILTISDMATTPNQSLILVIPALVQSEWEDNIGGVCTEVKKEVKKVDRKINVFNTCVAELGLDTEEPKKAFADLKLDQKLKGLSNQLLTCGIKLDRDESIQIRATNRAIRKEAPARAGSFKDCIIYEHAIELLSILREKGFSKKCLFLTSNTKDFCLDNDKKILKEPIKEELEKLSTGFVSNWDWAHQELTS